MNEHLQKSNYYSSCGISLFPTPNCGIMHWGEWIHPNQSDMVRTSYLVVHNCSKGQTTIAVRLLKPILKIEDSMEQEWMAEKTVDQPNIPPQLSIDHFSFEELHNVMKRNGSQVPELF